jgi:hypothetical protein
MGLKKERRKEFCGYVNNRRRKKFSWWGRKGIGCCSSGDEGGSVRKEERMAELR